MQSWLNSDGWLPFDYWYEYFYDENPERDFDRWAEELDLEQSKADKKAARFQHIWIEKNLRSKQR